MNQTVTLTFARTHSAALELSMTFHYLADYNQLTKVASLCDHHETLTPLFSLQEGPLPELLLMVSLLVAALRSFVLRVAFATSAYGTLVLHLMADCCYSY